MTETYQERLDRFESVRALEDARGLRLGWARLVVFLVALALYVTWDVASGPLRNGSGGGSLLALLVFIVLVLIHRRCRARQRWYETMATINREALARIGRTWDGLPPNSMAPPSRGHPYALDLDICGETSLFRLLSTVTTPPGRETLRSWLLEPALPAQIRRRQEGVSELAPELHTRQLLEAEGKGLKQGSPAAVNRFLDWAEEEPWLRGRAWLVAGAWVLPLATVVLGTLFFNGTLAGPWWLLSLVAAFALGGMNQVKIHDLMSRAGSGEGDFGRYGALLARMEAMDFEAPILRELKEAVFSSPVGAERELQRLSRRLGWADVRRSSLAHAPLQALVVWDVHVLASLERWKARSGEHVREWLEALGTLEALSALAALQGDHPDWCLPRVAADDSEPLLQARGLGHPLLSQDSCVRNDVEVGPPGSFLFLTGSNMSGKSTLLRAVGMNAVLAQAGGPVCAREMSLSPLRVQTSMRTTDSLTEGISQYMAELNRIRQVVETARNGGNVPPALYLLDEPLQGTNEAERRVAVQTILGHLLDAGAVGGVATHDLQLDETDRLREAARAAHLEGSVREGDEGPLLEFDYRLKPGRATSTNALALLRAVGLGE